ncbi:response regulator receiver protein [Cellulophaga algicola DSM 14237]|uniref:Response regulator receiver protein n=1 Tax=Cellulophaga algicola (strain DSM 14237 / IC166 / ACAM 630) TaxID=688270 RepID=E6X7V9_CELAD|nr:response regulator [Cellulophaga algicola]ADV47552.1 response regulator receiver protein [Cellulophaga algicola DSM 14237]
MKCSILIVEDNFIIQMFLEEILLGCGEHTVKTANNAAKALLVLENFKPNVILMDIGIGPGLDGIEVAEIIKEKYHIPVVFLTGNSDQATIARAHKANPIHFIFKPIDEEKLLAEFSIIKEKLIALSFQLSPFT